MHVTQQKDTKKTLFALAKQVQVSQKVEKKNQREFVVLKCVYRI